MDISDDDAADTVDEYARILGSSREQSAPSTKADVINAVVSVVQQFPTRSSRGTLMPKPTLVIHYRIMSDCSVSAMKFLKLTKSIR